VARGEQKAWELDGAKMVAPFFFGGGRERKIDAEDAEVAESWYGETLLAGGESSERRTASPRAQAGVPAPLEEGSRGMG